MLRQKLNKSTGFLCALLLLWGCSTTKNLPEGEVLYTGIKELKITSPEGEKIQPQAESQVLSALEVAPNNALLGSSKIRIPFPFGLWIYNAFKTDKKKGLKKWIFDKLASDPVLISKVEPSVRCKVAETLMDDNGYFDGKVTYEVIPNKKNPRMAKISYFVNFPTPYTYSSIEYVKTNTPSDSLIQKIAAETVLKPGQPFNVNLLEDERTRISDFLRDRGYYYFRPDFISYLADSTQQPHKIALRIQPKTDLPSLLLKPWRIGKIDYTLNNSYGRPPTDTIEYKRMGIFYRKNLQSRPPVLYRNLRLHEGDLFSQSAQEATQRNLNRLNTFKFVEIRFTPQDTTHTVDSLHMIVDATYDLPLDGELELNVTTKSNKQTGPGIVFGVTRRNLFKGGEVLNAELTGSYEWMTGQGAQNSGGSKLINSYEFGATSTLTIPRLIAPGFMHRDWKYPATTSLKLNANLLNRAGFFKLLTIGGSGQYDFQSSETRTHSVTPFSLTYSYLMHTTAAFDTVMDQNQALKQSFENQFIPSMKYTYTYDDGAILTKRNHLWYQGSITQAGNILYGAMDLLGNKQGNDKTIFGRKFSQFLKVTSEVRYYYKLGEKSMLAMRLMGGILKPYLNSQEAPYSEQFFIGGANSIRAFAVRTIGPGSYHPAANALYSYLDQTGNLKLEANIEYRFPIIGNLYGATFLDAGNVWILKKESARPGGEFRLDTFGKEIALGTGVGLRFDITYLVLRFDVGVPIHAPYQTTKSGYYNIPKFWSGLGYHIAIGYPF
ncbi:MAG: BamA/TamA family outer membrane protein [Bacteroidales bacterium]